MKGTSGQSVRAVAGNNRSRGQKKDLQIQPERPCRRISQIEADHLVERDTASSVHLPEPGDAGLHFQQAPAVPDIVGLELIRDSRTWPHQRHLAPQYVKELWELIEAGFPDEAADARQPRVVRQLVNGFAVRFGRPRLELSRDEALHILHVDLRIVHEVHGSELEAREGSAELADALLTEQDRPG